MSEGMSLCNMESGSKLEPSVLPKFPYVFIPVTLIIGFMELEFIGFEDPENPVNRGS